MKGKYLFQIRFVEGDFFTLCADTIERAGSTYIFKVNNEEVARYAASKVVGWSKSDAPNNEDD